MGSGVCCDDKTIAVNAQLTIESTQLVYDIKNRQISSYNVGKDNQFVKNKYDWYAIPIVSQLNLKDKSGFSVRNDGIMENSFLVGVIKQSAVVAVTSKPWVTKEVICFQSIDKKDASGIIYDNQIAKCGRTIRKGQTVTVTISRSQVQFYVGEEKLGSRSLPQGFLNDNICPYIALFHAQSRATLLGAVRAKN